MTLSTIQDVPIKKTISKIIISVTVAVFITKYPKVDSGDICSKVCYNISFGLKFSTFWTKSTFFLREQVITRDPDAKKNNKTAPDGLSCMQHNAGM